MALVDEISKWNDKKVLIIGDALIDKYIFGYTDKISPDAPVPNVKIEKKQCLYWGNWISASICTVFRRDSRNIHYCW